MKILVVDQFSGPSPYWLQQNPTNFEELCQEMLSRPSPRMGNKTEVLDVDEKTYKVKFCTTVFREGTDPSTGLPNGMAEVWKYSWDSSD